MPEREARLTIVKSAFPYRIPSYLLSLLPLPHVVPSCHLLQTRSFVATVRTFQIQLSDDHPFRPLPAAFQ